MTKPTFQWQLSLGNVIQIAMLLVAGAVGWTTFDARIGANEKAIDTTAKDVVQMEARLRVQETNAARSDERLASIFNLLTRMDARLERIERSDTR